MTEEPMVPMDPPLAPDELVSVGDERDVLTTFLDMYRGIVRRKLSGVAEEQVRKRLVPSLTTLAGLVSHLTRVEREWFQATLLQQAPDGGGNDGWSVPTDATVATLLADYESACEQSRMLTV